MAFRSWLSRFGQKQDENRETKEEERQQGRDQTAPFSKDGWIELVEGRVVVHDPVGDGRYPTLTPDPGIQLWINGVSVDAPMVVTEADEIRYEVQPDAGHFMDLAISEDEMTVTMRLTADPYRLPDTVALVGSTQVRIQPACSAKAQRRSDSPQQVVADRLKELGVVYGIDEAAVEAALKGPLGQLVVIARGQAPQSPVPGQWVWRLGEWSLVEAGQIIAEHQGGRPNLPQITVRGQETKVYDDIEDGQAYLAGQGTRMLGRARLIASVSGRARAVPTPDGMQVSIFPVKVIQGDFTGQMETESDLVIEGSVRGATIRSTGEVVVAGGVAESEIYGGVINVAGEVAESSLYTIPKGHYLPLKADLLWLQRSLTGILEGVERHSVVKEETFREIQSRVRILRRRGDEIGISDPEYLAFSDQVAQAFLGARGAEGLDAGTVKRLVEGLQRLADAAETYRHIGRVSAGALIHVTVWAGGDIEVADRVANSFLYCGGSIRTPEKATLTQSELVAGEEVTLGILASVRGTAPVTVRAGGRMLIEQVDPGCVLEYGVDRREFKGEMIRIVAGANAKGQLVVRQRD